jgi:pSer/pThr/pTyr-binding forkhead associated (FHA) protein
VQRINFSNKTSCQPHLEINSGGELRRVEVAGSRFTIGRAETADFQIDSPQVSREHAQLLERSGVWFIRDLNSMNGTQVNGKSVSEALLSDGDLLTIAETDLTFIATKASQFQRMVTQPIPSRQREVPPVSIPVEIMTARAATEAMLWQVIPTELFEVVSLSNRAVLATLAGSATSSGPPGLAMFSGLRHAAAERYRELHRVRTMEMASVEGGARQMFVTIDALELEVPDRLFSSLERIHELVPNETEVGLAVSLQTTLDTLKLEEVCRAARNQGLHLAFAEFQGSGGQVLHLDAIAPDYLILSESMVKDLESSRQPLRRLESVRAACDQLQIKPVLPRIVCEQVTVLCEQVGYDLVLRAAALDKEASGRAYCIAN